MSLPLAMNVNSSCARGGGSVARTSVAIRNSGGTPRTQRLKAPGPGGMRCGVSPEEMRSAGKGATTIRAERMLPHPFHALGCVRIAAALRGIAISDWDIPWDKHAEYSGATLAVVANGRAARTADVALPSPRTTDRRPRRKRQVMQV